MRLLSAVLPAALAGFGLPGGTAFAMPGAMPWDHAGGPGRPDCTACHFESGATAQSPALRITGWPGKAEPGKSYALVLRLEAELAAAGFLMRAEKTSDMGAPAGRFLPADDRTEAGEGALRSTVAGTKPAAPGKAEWRFSWQAPGDFTGPVTLYIAAVAADDDRSPLGDRVHLRQLDGEVAPPGR